MRSQVHFWLLAITEAGVTCWELGPANIAAGGVVERLQNCRERDLAAIVPARVTSQSPSAKRRQRSRDTHTSLSLGTWFMVILINAGLALPPSTMLTLDRAEGTS